MMHLWASHWVSGLVSGTLLITKNLEMCLRIVFTWIESVISVGSNLHFLVKVILSWNSRVIVIGWWSDKNMGSIVAALRRREICLCETDIVNSRIAVMQRGKNVQSFSPGCRVRQVSWSKRLRSWSLICLRTRNGKEDVPDEVSSTGCWNHLLQWEYQIGKHLGCKFRFFKEETKNADCRCEIGRKWEWDYI